MRLAAGTRMAHRSAGLTGRVRTWVAALLLVVMGLAWYWPVSSLVPFEEDNVYVLAWAAATPPSRVLAVDPHYYPEWRPLAYATVWLEQHLGAPVRVHFGVNLLLWIACAWLVYVIARHLAASQAAGFLAAALVLTDPRATWALVAIVERQTSLACVFGLCAVALAVTIETPLTAVRQVALAALLVASMLSKEYGAAFTAALALFGMLTRRGDLVRPAMAAALLYLAIRMIVVGAIVQPYCEEMYLFGTARDICLDVTDPASVTQLIYNVMATLVNLPLLGLLSGTGAPIFAESRLLTGLLFSALAIAALMQGPRATRLLALIVIANAALSLMIYRDRNQLAGACAMAILSAIGWRIVTRRLPDRRWHIALATLIFALLGAQAALARALVVERGAIAAQIEPCRLEIMNRDFVPRYVAALKMQYGMRDPDCRARN